MFHSIMAIFLSGKTHLKTSSLLITRWLLFDYVCIMPCSEHFRFNQAPCENLFWVICLTVIAFAEWKKIEMRIFTWSHLGILKLRTSRTELKEGHLSKVPLLLPPSFLFPPSSVALVFVYFEVKGAVTAVQFIFFYFTNYSPSIAMELKVGKKITCKWQNQRLEINKCVCWALCLKLQTAEINSQKLLGWAVLKNPNFNPFQTSSVLPVRGSCCICCVILTLINVLSGYFYVSFNLMDILQ